MTDDNDDRRPEAADDAPTGPIPVFKDGRADSDTAPLPTGFGGFDGYGPSGPDAGWTRPADEPWWVATSPPVPPRASPRRLGIGAAALLLAVGAIAGAALSRAVVGLHALHLGGPGRGVFGPGNFVPSAPATARGGTGTSNLDTAAIARLVDPAVVDINVTIGYQHAEAAGTGIVLTPDGEVLTNNHVIAGATQVSVTDVGNGRTYPARVVGYDRGHDVAVLQLSGASGLATVTVGDSSAVQPGATVVAIGNAGGSGGTPSVAGGTVTAVGQSVTASDDGNGTSETLSGLIETNADVVPGDSGGPLVDTRARVIGLDAAASAGFRLRASASQAFAIPINQALAIARQVESGTSSGSVHVGPTAMLGVSVQASGGDPGGQAPGALVADVVNGGPADQAGIAGGDVITALAGRAVTSPEDLTAALVDLRPGASVTVSYLDAAGGQQTTTVVLGSGPPQ